MPLLTFRSEVNVSSIFVHPPTPDKEKGGFDVGATNDTSVKSGSKTPSPLGSPGEESKTTTRVVPVLGSSPTTTAKPLHVLPEVRSPPKAMISLAAEKLMVQRKPRRAGMFGFTEMPSSSGSSAASSRAGSRTSSPTRDPSPLPASRGPSSLGNPIPRRSALRTRSETNLPTLAKTSPSRLSQPPQPTSRRKRENGLKLDFTGIIPVANQAEEETRSSVVTSPYPSTLKYKKSGEILKPALKYGGPLAANGTPLEGPRTDCDPSSPAGGVFGSKSCPTTPSCPKYVHFDAQLEHIKLFLQDQKPKVVSRAGSPTAEYTTSEGEEYPFPSTDTEEEREASRVLQIKLPNFPTSHVPGTELYLESLFLDDDRKALRGMLICKNISFQKWVAVRFTTDFWQTTSEVTATFKDSVKGGTYDRFQFVIKLADMLARIEEKTMFLAIRYNTDGREIWDSNGGQNYQVLFEKVAAKQPETVPKRKNTASIQPGMGQAVGGRTSQWSVTGGNADDRLADLRARLSLLTAEDDEANRPIPLSPRADRSFGFKPPRRAPAKTSPTSQPTFSSDSNRSNDLPSAGPALAARYDFGSALKTARKSSPPGQKKDLPDVQTGLLKFGKVNNGHAATEFYTPKLTMPQGTDPTSPSQAFFSPTVSREVKAVPNNPPSMSRPAVPHRFATDSSVATLRTAARGPTIASAIASKQPSPPLVEVTENSPPPLLRRASTDTLPSDSPQSPEEVSLPRWPASEVKPDAMSSHYSSLLEQFCWGGTNLQTPLDPPPKKVHSTSSLDAYFAEARQPAWGAMSASNSPAETPRPMSLTLPPPTGYFQNNSPEEQGESQRYVDMRDGMMRRVSPSSVVC